MNNLLAIVGFVLIGAYIVKRNRAEGTAPAGTPQTINQNGTLTNPAVTYEDVVATMQVNPGWVPQPFTNEWHVLFPNGVPDLGLGDSSFLNFQT